MDSMLHGNMNFSELLNSLSPEVRQALESGSMVQLLSSLRSMLPNVSNNSEEAKKQKKASLLAMYLSIAFYVLAAFSSLLGCALHTMQLLILRAGSQNTLLDPSSLSFILSRA